MDIPPLPQGASSGSGALSGDPASGSTSKLGGMIIADYEAVRNDLDQARQLAADFQYQLSGKSNECADLKALLEKSSGDLGKLQEAITELRKERHRLANEANRTLALELRLEKVLSERDQLRGEVEVLRNRSASQTQALALAQSQVRTPSPSPAVASPTANDPAVQRILGLLQGGVADLRALLEHPSHPGHHSPSARIATPPPLPAKAPPPPQDVIEISFGD